MKKLIHEVLSEVAKSRSKQKKVEILRENESGALHDILKGTFDPRIVWLLPVGAPPPYTKNKPESVPSNLLKECVKLAYFVKGGKGPDLPKHRREALFIGVLESIHPKDAEILVGTVNKKAPRGVTYDVVKEAFPKLLP